MGGKTGPIYVAISGGNLIAGVADGGLALQRPIREANGIIQSFVYQHSAIRQWLYGLKSL